MAKLNKQVTKKALKQVNKIYKKSPKIVIFTLLIVALLFVGASIYLYHNGYLDKYLFQDPEGKQEENLPPEVGDRQDENGFYYYSLEGYAADDYYYRAKNLSNDALVSELKIIIRDGFIPVKYENAKYILSYSDRNPLDNNESVRGIYDDDVIATHWIGVGAGAWQREHVWPNSKLGIPRVGESSKSQGSDLHNLRAITGINQKRSNRYFAAGSGNAVTVGAEGFYPGDDHKGDVARILFYMAIMYDILNLTNDINLLINDSDTNYKPQGAYSGLLDLLIAWHKEDPVDDFERQRNEFIYKGVATDLDGKEVTSQGNRNPFIDKPEYVHLIWEDKTIDDLSRKTEPIEKTSEREAIIYYISFNRRDEWLDLSCIKKPIF